MNRDEILQQLSERKDLKEIIRKITDNDKYYSQELQQELFVVLCELPEDRLIQMFNEKWLDWYIIRTLSNMFNSESSRFYYKIKKPIKNKVDHETEDGNNLFDLFESELKFKG